MKHFKEFIWILLATLSINDIAAENFQIVVNDIYQPYIINSADYSQFLADIGKHGPKSDAIATLVSELRVGYKLFENDGCTFDITHVEFNYKFKTPILSEKAKLKRLPTWNFLMDEIRKHEVSHKEINHRVLSQFLHAFDNTNFQTCELALQQYSKAKKAAYDKLEIEQARLDRKGIDNFNKLRKLLKRDWMQKEGITLSFQN